MTKKQTEKDAEPAVNALTGFARPVWDLVGPTVKDDISRAIVRYGADAVKAAVKEATKAKRGRKAEPDYKKLAPIFKEDAASWLEGNDPFSERTNYAIAKQFAEKYPGHDVYSTRKRIEGKLSKGPHDRRWWTYATAMGMSRTGYPYEAHLKALEAMANLPAETGPDIWRTSLNEARSAIADYEAREGKLPPAEMNIEAIKTYNSGASLNALISPPVRGLFGKPVPKTAKGGILARTIEGEDN